MLYRLAGLCLLIFLGLCGLTACGSQPVKEPESVPSSPQLSAEALQAQREAARIKAREEARQNMVNGILAKAAKAMDQGRYTRPLDDNAFDYYHAALIFYPQNQTALTGLENIQLNYLDMIRDAASRGLARDAREYYRSLAQAFPNSKLLEPADDLIKNIKLVKQVEPRELSDELIEKIELPTALLSQRGPEISVLLSDVAQKITNLRARVIIYARSDAEGRWIYQNLKDRADGYRIRGDIRISSSPHLNLLEPL